MKFATQVSLEPERESPSSAPVDLQISDPPRPVRPRYHARYPPAVTEALKATVEAGVKSGRFF